MQRFATPDGYVTITNALFNDMFTGKSEKTVIASAVERALRLPRSIGEKMLTDMLRYDITRLTASLASLRVPVMAIQTTRSNERRERMTLREGQTTPYLDMVRANVPSVRVEIIAGTGHFPQLDEPARTNELIDSFLAMPQIAG
jgi:pimeloyl-ACP methyl ester carboxylesterase